MGCCCSAEKRERDDMTMDESGRQYQIPGHILEEYERWVETYMGLVFQGTDSREERLRLPEQKPALSFAMS